MRTPSKDSSTSHAGHSGHGRRGLLRFGLSGALLGVAGLALAGGWSEFAASFPGLPCQDGWAGCVVDGTPMSPGMVLDKAGRPHASNMRVGFFDFDPLPAFSPFQGLSSYTGEGVASAGGEDQADSREEEEAVASAAAIDAAAREAAAEELAAAREASEASAAAAAAEVAARAEADARRQAEEAARKQAQEAERQRKEAEAAMAAAADASARAEAQRRADEARKQEEAARKAAEEQSRRAAEAEAARKAAEAEAKRKAEEEAKKQAEAEAARKAAEDEARRKAEAAAAEAAARKAADDAAAAKAKADAAAAASQQDAVAAAMPTATATPPAAQAPASCDNLVALEVPAMMGQLGVGVRGCLEERLGTEGSQTSKDKISRVLIADAEARRDQGDWERLMKRHLETIDRSDPNLCFKYALHLSRGGASRATGVIRWADYALENKQQWQGANYTKNVNGLLKIRAQAANALWQAAEKALVEERNDENEAKAERYRGTTKDYAREWLDYARASGQETSAAMAMCVSAAGNREFCGG